MSWYLKVLKKYAVFSGRARRMEYWMFVLVSALISVGLMIVEYASGMEIDWLGYGPLTLLYSLFVLIPGLAVSVRRLHDIDKTGWWVLIGLIPVIGTIVLIIFTVRGGNPGDNRYGSNPKQMAMSAAPAA